MLTDIFAHRYDGVPLRATFTDRDARLMVQLFRIIEERVQPYWVGGEVEKGAEVFWKNLHSKLSMELGLTSLSNEWYTRTYGTGTQTWTQQERWSVFYVCKNWMLSSVASNETADDHIKNRLSFVELAFRLKSNEIDKAINNAASFASKSILSSFIKVYTDKKENIKSSIEELNERLRRSGYSLHYHNGFLQMSKDSMVEKFLEEPFWNLVSDTKWRNVDIDMKEAIDRRDAGGREPALYAAKALESTIKIISDIKGLSKGTEKGAHQYIDNLVSSKTGRFIASWEAEQIKGFFTRVRNPLGHGPGLDEMPSLTAPQTDWAIAFSMASIRSLIVRM